MNVLCRLAGGVGMTLLGFFLVTTIPHTEASQGAISLSTGRKPSPSMKQPGVPAGRPLYSPPAFTERSAPISERPFAEPFIDRSPSIAERPLPPIGGGHPSSREAAPWVWCQGRWIQADQVWRGCAPW